MMELLKLLNKALWISAIVFAVYWLVKYLYQKFKPRVPSFFYLHSVTKAVGEWKVRIEAPSDNFPVDIRIFQGNDLLVQKKASLKAGFNNISVKSPALTQGIKLQVRVKAEDQKIDRTV